MTGPPNLEIWHELFPDFHRDLGQSWTILNHFGRLEPPNNIKQHQTTSNNIKQHQTTSNNIKQHQTTSSNIKQHQTTSNNIKQHQTTSNNIKQHQTTSNNIKQHQTTSNNIKQHQTTSNNIKQHQTTSNNIKQHQTTSNNIKQHQTTSNNIKQHQTTSNNLKQPQTTSNNLKQPQTTSNNLKQPQTTSNNLKQPQTTSNNLKQPQIQPTSTNTPSFFWGHCPVTGWSLPFSSHPYSGRPPRPKFRQQIEGGVGWLPCILLFRPQRLRGAPVITGSGSLDVAGNCELFYHVGWAVCYAAILCYTAKLTAFTAKLTAKLTAIYAIPEDDEDGNFCRGFWTSRHLPRCFNGLLTWRPQVQSRHQRAGAPPEIVGRVR